MPTLAQLPTDNLYKFFAIAGLALIIFGIYLFVSHLVKVEAKIDSLQHDEAQTGAKVTYLEREVEAKQKTAVTAQELDDIIERILQVRLLHEKNVVNTAILKRLNARLRTLLLVSKTVIVAGLILTVTGFVLWYCKTQQQQDALLEIQLKQAAVGQAPGTTH